MFSYQSILDKQLLSKSGFVSRFHLNPGLVEPFGTVCQSDQSVDWSWGKLEEKIQ